ncbi:MAG: U32 family peptidase [Lachnospiraceae bacterium]|nr:U32 family peptidase [Lachnospiraceae bacterium]
MIYKPEILAPAGSMEALISAVNAGCDAVYVGGSSFGARAYAGNFDENELLAAINLVHRNNKKIYLTVNTLFKEDEIEYKLLPFILPYYKEGLDAVIVQDLGVMRRLKDCLPGIDLHLSTQMTLLTPEGAELMVPYGATRVVPARELSIEEIADFKNKSKLELEIFVHGALCYAYSGQCLMSSLIGGRSGNRGRCAGPCRKMYNLSGIDSEEDNNGYFLSMKDLCTIDSLKKLIDLKVDSFKIEGRMKSPEYVAGVTKAYRTVADIILSEGIDIEKTSQLIKNELADLYNRGGFTKGYFSGKADKMVDENRQNHNGIEVGRVKSFRNHQALIATNLEINKGDVLEIRSSGSDKAVYEFTVGQEGFEYYENTKHVVTNVYRNFNCNVGDCVFRTKNEQLLNSLHNEYTEKNCQSKIKGKFSLKKGERIKLELVYETYKGKASVTVLGDEASESVNRPVTDDTIFQKLNKTGESQFVFDELEIKNDNCSFIRIGALNEIRRSAFDSLAEKVRSLFLREIAIEDIENKNKVGSADSAGSQDGYNTNDIIIRENNDRQNFINSIKAENNIIAEVRNYEQLIAVKNCLAGLKDKEVKIAINFKSDEFEKVNDAIKSLRANKIGVYLVIPSILSKKVRRRFETIIFSLKDNKPDGFVLQSLDAISFVKEQFGQDSVMIAGYNLYSYNSYARKTLSDLGVSSFVESVELNKNEIQRIKDRKINYILAYGRIPVMFTENCVFKTNNLCGKNQGADTLILKDEKNMDFIVERDCGFCMNTIYNGKINNIFDKAEEIRELSANGLYLKFVDENSALVETVINGTSSADKGYTHGHFTRGIE